MSAEDFEGAVENAISRAEATTENLRRVSVVNRGVGLSGAERESQAATEVTFERHGAFGG